MNHYSREQTPVQYTAAAIKVLHLTVPPHESCFRTHWHDRIELLRIQQGEMRVHIGTVTTRVTAGQVVIFPPQTLHHGIAGDTGVTYDVLSFDVRSFYNTTDACSQLLPTLYDGTAVLQNVTDRTDTVRCVDALCHHLDRNSISAVAMVYQLLDELFSSHLLSIKTNDKPDIIKEITAYIEDNYDQEIDTALLCERYGYTPAHLCRKFKTKVGMTPMNYLKIYRLERAYKYITSEKSDISSIAAKCGFADANYFTRCFTAHFGHPPTYYRKHKLSEL